MNMKKSALSALILTCLFTVAVSVWDKHVRKEKKWKEARKHCTEHYNDLVSISNQAQDNRLRSKMLKRVESEFWIGLYKEEDGVWKWSGGTEASFFNWADADERDSEDKCCAVIHETGWRRKKCEDKFQFVCLNSKLVLVKENKTWEEAMEQCHTQHGDLVSLTSEIVVARTLAAIGDAQADHVWTGMRYLADSWLWVNGDEVEYQAWSTGDQPQCPAWTHHCGALSLTGKHLESWDCADKLNFVCFEKEDNGE